VASISHRITINRRAEDIWHYVTQPQNWAGWWGGGLKRVSPAWEKGAHLEWENGPSSTLSRCDPPKVMHIEGPQVETWLTLYAKGKSTFVELEDRPMGNAFFTDGGASRMAHMETQLERLKSLIEAATPSPSPVACTCGRPATAHCEYCGNEFCAQHLTRETPRACLDCSRRCAVCKEPTVSACGICWEPTCNAHLTREGRGKDEASICVTCASKIRKSRRNTLLTVAGVVLVVILATVLYFR
jgi:hypothetical protein